MNTKEFIKQHNEVKPIAKDAINKIFTYQVICDLNETQRHNAEIIVIDAILEARKVSQARLTLAHELIAALTNNGLLSPRLMTPETKALWERWQAEEMTK